MKAPLTPLFLARHSYRSRRIMDFSRLLPVIGLFLFFLPLLWGRHGGSSAALIFLFASWFILIVLGAVTARLLGRGVVPEDASEAEDNR